VIGAAIVVAANVVLRPLVQRINRQPLDQTEQNEEAVRAGMLAQIRATTLRLLSLASHDADPGRRPAGV